MDDQAETPVSEEPASAPSAAATVPDAAPATPPGEAQSSAEPVAEAAPESQPPAATEGSLPPEPADAVASRPLADINLLDDVDLDVKIELGRTRMYIADVLRLGPGSVVELDKLAGDPVDVYVNERLVARGEVLVLNDNFCVRINDIVSSTLEVAEIDQAQ